MKIKTADFHLAAAESTRFVDDLPQIAILGRSNVGKSSLINFLVNRKRLAKSGGRPGVTQKIIYFKINESFYLVDLPGIGYAALSKTQRAEMQDLMEQYLNSSRDLRGILYLLDSRIKQTAADISAIQWLNALEIPWLPVFTKSDKLGKQKAQTAALELAARYDLEHSPLITSTLKKWGKDQVWEQIQLLLNEP